MNNSPDQQASRFIIHFHDWPLEKAECYPDAINHLRQFVKPWRDNNSRLAGIPWWQFERPRLEIYEKLRDQSRCFLAAATTKHFNFSCSNPGPIFLNTIFIFVTDRWDLYTVVQSTIHEVWARKYSGALKQDLRYSPSKCFDTFAFPGGLWATPNPVLAAIGECYHEHRRELMLRLWLGLTDIYNLFHNPDLTPEKVAKVSGKPAEADTGQAGISRLRELHRELDEAVLAAYGWRLRLGHGFHEIETLPENDRVRYTISPEARKEILSRLLVLNHERHAEQVEAETKKPTSKRKSAKAATLPLVEDTPD